MKRRILYIYPVIAACLCAVLASCQDVFSSSPFSALLGRHEYPDFAGMSVQERMAVADEALSSGNADLAAELLPLVLDDYPGMDEGAKPAGLALIVQLALLTTNVSKAVAGAMNVLPADEAEMTADQYDAFRRCMEEILIGPDADEAFDLLSAAGETSVRGVDYLFSGLALVQSIVRGQSEIHLADMSDGEAETVMQGMALVAVGEARLLEEGYDPEVVASIGGLVTDAEMEE